jgi:hypothetical protein
MLRAGLVVALVTGALTGVAAPAFADDTLAVQVFALTPFNPGDTQTLQVQVQNQKNNPDLVQVSVTGLSNNFTVSNPQNCTRISGSSCTVTVQGAQSSSVSFTVKATANVPAGQKVNDAGTVQVQDTATHSDSKSFQAIINGPAPPTSAAPSTVPQVKGTVRDVKTGANLSGATVSMQDSAGHTCQAGTNNSGAFSFTSCAGSPIATGTLAVIVTKDGYAQKNSTADGVAGRAVTLAIVLGVTAASASASSQPSDDGSVAALPTLANSGSVQAVQTAVGAGGGTGGSGFSKMLILVGVVLVLLGLGAIALILWRRRSDRGDGDEDDGDDDGGPRRGGPAPVPGSRGAYRGAPADATAVVRSGGYGDPTTIQRDPMADAPTMITNRPRLDEYEDPYGAPAPTQQYGGGGYGNSAGYGEPTGVYEPTGAYTPPTQRPPADPYAAPREYAGYGSEPAGYGDDQATRRGGGYPAPSGGGYDAPGAAGPGYSDSTRPYSGGGYDNAGYEPAGGAPTGGYDQPGYQPRRGYGGDSGGYAGGDDYRGGAEPPAGRGGGHGASPTSGGEYGQRPGYGSPTGGGGYDAPAGGYEPGAPSSPGGYDRGGYSGAGNDEGYPGSGGGYDRGGNDGYRGGAGSGGYGDYEPREEPPPPPPRGGYEPRGAHQQPDPGYQPRGGYEPRGGHQEPEQQRRSLDWLDD